MRRVSRASIPALSAESVTFAFRERGELSESSALIRCELAPETFILRGVRGASVVLRSDLLRGLVLRLF